MGDWIQLNTADGKELSAYAAEPDGKPLGGLVIIQEIFGVNKSIREVVDSYATEGFVAIAPALFDRIEKGIELGYGPEDMQKAFQLYPRLNPDHSLIDVAAAFQYVAAKEEKNAVLGFCYGGLLSWLSATRGKQHGMEPTCCVGYYAGGVGKVATEEPTCPVMLHFGADDDHIGKDQVDAVRSAHPDVQIFTYDGAGHAFANAQRSSFEPEAAKLARERSLAFLKQHLGS